MPETLRPETKERISALCEKISVSFDLDPDIQEELYGHLEDKLQAYMSGEERLTEEDAFILVREHFGSPAAIKVLFQDVHVRRYHVGFARRIMAVLAATSGVMILQSGVFFLMTVALIVWANTYGVSDNARVFLAVVMASIQVASVVLIGYVLYHWQQCIDQGIRPWFIRWGAPTVITILILMAIVQRAIPMAHAGPLLSFDPYPTSAWVAYVFYVACIEISMVFGCLVWLWWCDRPPRTARAVTYAFAAWMSVQILGFLIPPPQLSICITEYGMPFKDLFAYVNIAQGPLADDFLTWYLRWEVPSSFRFYAGVQVFIMCVFAGYLSRLLYRLIPRLQQIAVHALM
jgi:hypothetical protein